MEHLEGRQLLAHIPALFGGSVELADDVLLVEGTPRSDDIRLQSRTSGLFVRINGRQYGPFQPERVVVSGLDGNDYLHADAKVSLPLELHGGAGRDRLVGGRGPDILHGDAGNDFLNGGRGDDQAEGGPGNDFISGGPGNDDLSGGDGNDQLFAGAGNDLASAGGGRDLVVGGAGHDMATGGDDNDRLIGQAGRDLLIGGDGVDRLEGGNDDDILVAGQSIYDEDVTALHPAMANWTAKLAYAARVDALFADGSAQLSRTTVIDDQDLDTLLGARGADLFLAAPSDRLLDRGRLESLLITDSLTLPQVNRAVVAGPGVQQMPSVAVDPHDPNHVVIAYMDYALPTADADLPGEGYAGIGVAVSRDGGITWRRTAIPLPAGFDEGAANPIAKFDDQGQVFVSFMSVTFLGTNPPITNGDFFNPEIGASDRAPGMQANNGIFVVRSDDGGRNWNTPVAVVSHLYQGQDVPFEAVPDLAVDTFRLLPNGQRNPNYGNLYSVWTRLYPPGQQPGHPEFHGGGDLMIGVSRDHGQTWEIKLQTQPNVDPVTVLLDPLAVCDTLAGTACVDQAHPAIGPEGDVYVANFGGGDFAVQHSTDGGESFTVPNHETGQWLAFGPGVTSFANVSGLPNNPFRTHHSRSIVADPIRPGHVYAVEQIKILDAEGKTLDPADVFFARSTDYGQTWQSVFKVGVHDAEVLNDENDAQKAEGKSPQEVVASQALPRLGIDALGNISVVWLDARRDPSDHLLDVFGTVSTDGGLTFSTNFRVSGVSFDADLGRFTDVRGQDNFYLGDYLGLTLQNETAYAAWTDTQNGNQDVVFSRFQLDPPPAPLNDRFEPNATATVATNLSTVSQRALPKLVAAAGDEDWFEVTAAATGNFIASALFEKPDTATPSSLRVELWNDVGTIRLATDRELIDEQGVTVGREVSQPGNHGQRFLVRVIGSSNGSSASVRYSLKLQSLTGDLGPRAKLQVNGALEVGGAALYLLQAPASGSLELELTNGSDVLGDLKLRVLDAETLADLINPQPVLVPAAEENDSIGQATATGLMNSGSVLAFGEIGDGPFGSTTGDYDFYRVQADAGQQITVDVSAKAVSSSLDSVLGLFDSAGELLAAKDAAGPGDSELLTFVTDKPDTYAVLVAGCCAGAVFPSDPLTAGTGTGAAGTGAYRITITSEPVGRGAVKRLSLPVQQHQAVLVQVSGSADSSGSFALAMTNLDQFTTGQNASLLFPAGDGPSQAALADLNADGKLDLAVANAQSDTVSVLLGTGDGTFQTPRQFAIGAFVTPNIVVSGRAGTFRRQVVVGDFSSDSIPDLAVTNFDSSDVSVLLGRGDGTFGPQRRFNATGAPFDVAIGDFDGDGDLDLTTVDSGSFVKVTSAVLLGRGNGTFEPQQTFTIPTAIADSYGPYAVEAIDLNEDGKDDLVLSGSSLHKLYVLLSNGDGTFTRIDDTDSARFGGGLDFGDINGDGNVDIVVMGVDDENQASVLLGNGDGSFEPRRDFFAGHNPIAVRIVDVGRRVTLPDGSIILGPTDGRPDLVVAVSGIEFAFAAATPPGVVVLPGLFDDQGAFLGFGAPLALADAVLPLDVDAGDVNGDGSVDMVVVDRDGVRVIYGKPPVIAVNNTIQSARDLGTVVHVVQPTLTITPRQSEAWYKLTVPEEVADGAGDQVLDFSGGFAFEEGPGLAMELTDAAGNVLASGERFRVVAAQDAELFVHVFGVQTAAQPRGAGAYTLIVNVLPQVAAVQAAALLPGAGGAPAGPTTKVVLTLQGDRLDPASAENRANYRVTWLGPGGQQGGGDDQVMPLSPAAQAVIYSPGSNVEIGSGITHPTAVRQTITLLFDAPLPAGSYLIELLPQIQTADFNMAEDALLTDTAAVAGHPLVERGAGGVTTGAAIEARDLVLAAAGPANFASWAAGTPFLSQLHDDLSAILDGALTSRGDDLNISSQINAQIRDRLVPALAGTDAPGILVLWIDPSSEFAIESDSGGIVLIAGNVLEVTLEQAYVDLIGNIEVIVIAAFEEVYELIVEDVPELVRAGFVFVDDTQIIEEILTDELRDGETQIAIDLEEIGGGE